MSNLASVDTNRSRPTEQEQSLSHFAKRICGKFKKGHYEQRRGESEGNILGQNLKMAGHRGTVAVLVVAICCWATMYLGLLSKAVACVVQIGFQLQPLQLPTGLTSRPFTLGSSWSWGALLGKQNTISGSILTATHRSSQQCERVAVLVHGWGQDRRDLLHAAPEYVARDFCVVVYDARWRGGLSWGSSEALDAAQVLTLTLTHNDAHLTRCATPAELP